MPWYRVSWFEYKGYSYVKAKNKKEAVEKAKNNEDVGWDDVDSYDSYPQLDERVDDKELEFRLEEERKRVAEVKEKKHG